jgi:hypothetical protein
MCLWFRISASPCLSHMRTTIETAVLSVSGYWRLKRVAVDLHSCLHQVLHLPWRIIWEESNLKRLSCQNCPSSPESMKPGSIVWNTGCCDSEYRSWKYRLKYRVLQFWIPFLKVSSEIQSVAIMNTVPESIVWNTGCCDSEYRSLHCHRPENLSSTKLHLHS